MEDLREQKPNMFFFISEIKSQSPRKQIPLSIQSTIGVWPDHVLYVAFSAPVVWLLLYCNLYLSSKDTDVTLISNAVELSV